MVVVNATDLAHAPDKSCILRAGDHPMIRKDSAMYYDLAELISIESLKRRIERRTAQPGPTADDALMEKIRQSAIDSRHTSREVRVAILRCPWRPTAAP